MPTLVDTIRIKNTQTLADRINLKGFMVSLSSSAVNVRCDILAMCSIENS